MPKTRSKQIALSETPLYLLKYRCVHRLFFCGEIDGCNFEHQCEGIVERLKLLTEQLLTEDSHFLNCGWLQLIF